jgi:hypothetical protein
MMSRVADRAEADLGAALAGAQRGDPAAFRTLYRDTQPRLLRYLHALVGDDAEDIASETWLQITRDLHTFHGTPTASAAGPPPSPATAPSTTCAPAPAAPRPSPCPPKTLPPSPPPTTPPPAPSTPSPPAPPSP